MPYGCLPAFMAELRARQHVGSGARIHHLDGNADIETIGARWSEIDLDRRRWASRRADEGEARSPSAADSPRRRATARLQSKGECVFGPRPLSNMAMLESCCAAWPAGLHGARFPLCFSDWARDRTGYARDLIEMALAHTIKDKSEAAYRRGDALDKRGRLMSEWARYLEAPAAVGDNVTALRSA